MTNRIPCVIGVAEHAGWAHVVCAAFSNGVPVVVDRRRVTLIDEGLPTMPYHHETLKMSVADADALIARVRKSIASCASRALSGIINDLTSTYDVVALVIRDPTFAGLPESVASVRRSYALQCAADGMMYQLALCDAARELGLDVHQYGRRESFEDVPNRPPGPPWTEEHRRAYAAAIAVLSSTVRT
ncbi:MAG TPA: hypothetical protein VFA59_15365 [Vicinamibacterales bacterium]|nr:hypothetical protein [Vicinamibacterales bacterium]